MIRLRFSATLFGAASLATLAVAGAAAATPNLITNPNFNAGISDWSGDPGTLAWSAGDHSLRVTNLSAPSLTTLAAAQQCITGIDDGSAYTLKADAFVPSGQKRHGGAHARIYWYAGATCNGAVLGSPFASAFITSFDSWIQSKDSFVAPAGAKSASIALGVQQYKADPGEDPTKHFTAKWDSVWFAKNEIVLDPPVTKTPSPTTTPPIIVIDPTGTPSPTKTPPIIVIDPTGTPTPTKTPPIIVVDPTGTSTPSPTGTPDNQQTAEPTETGTSTPEATPSQPHEPQVATTPNAPVSTHDNPLPPGTGSGASGDGGSDSMAMFDLFAAALGIVALGGLALAVAQVKRRD